MTARHRRTNTQIWFCRPEQLVGHDCLEIFRGWMTFEECNKEDRMRGLEHRQIQRLARGLVRSVLSYYFSGTPESWRFAAQRHGKPYVPILGPGVDFSISHTHGLVAVALSFGHCVGLDVEWLGREASPDLATAIMSPSEHRVWLALATPEEQHTRLLKLWTLKEAGVKASGEGIAFPVQTLSFDIDSQGQASVSTTNPMQDRRWACLRVGEAHQLAVCLQAQHLCTAPLLQLSGEKVQNLEAWPAGACTYIELT